MRTRFISLLWGTALAMILGLTGCGRYYQNQGDFYYNNLAYSEAIPFYNRALKHKERPDALRRLAECYRVTNQYELAEETYQKVVQQPGAAPINTYYLARMMMANKKYAQAKDMFGKFLLMKPGDPSALACIRTIDSLSALGKDADRYQVNQLPINTSESSFSPVYYKDGIVFVSERTEKIVHKHNDWTGGNYLDLYYAEKDSLGNWKTPVPLSGKVNSPVHEGPVTFSPDGNMLVFTRNNFIKGKKGKDSQGYNHLKLYTAQLEDGEWRNIQEFPYNSETYSTGHPAFSPDGKKLFFVSDKPGGAGGTDLYVSDWNGTTWGAPQSLGSSINTTQNEMFPFVHQDGTLYFSSDGWGGVGGLDVFSSTFQNGAWNMPQNLGMPINSSKDDFGYVVDKTLKNGMFSSNRTNSKGVDLIFSFLKKDKPPVLVFALEGLVVKKGTDKPVPGAMVELIPMKKGDGFMLGAGQNGTFFTPIPGDASYKIQVTCAGYFSANAEISTIGLKHSDTLFVRLELDTIIIDKPIVLKNIYYDFDKWNIRADAAKELDKLVQMLKDNPQIDIELSSHTDSRGTDLYNQVLSQKRAESAVKYIISKGIDPKRITAKGYGESMLVNECKDGVKCSDEAHQLNRRTEFKVVKINP